MVAACTEHTRSGNMEATFRGNHNSPVVMVTICTESTGSKYMEVLRGNSVSIA